MRKLYTLIMLFVCICMSAQQINGDINKNGQVDIEDVTSLINDYLNDTPSYIDNKVIDNSALVGTWYLENKSSANDGQISFNAVNGGMTRAASNVPTYTPVTFSIDGRTTLHGDYLYSYIPAAKILVITDGQSLPVECYRVSSVSPEELTIVNKSGSYTLKAKAPVYIDPKECATVNLAFYETVPGYNVKITDLRPKTPDADVIEGIVLTPSTKEQAAETWSDRKPSKSELPPYIAFSADAKTMQTRNNLVFSSTLSRRTPDYIYLLTESETITSEYLGTSRSDAASTKLLVPAIISNGSYITSLSNDTYTYYKGDMPYETLPSTYVADQTGFTVHFSMQLEATDGSGEVIKVNDARVHIPSDYCKWENNRTYTYVIKIQDIDFIMDEHYDNSVIDPSDPRVLRSQAQRGIFFEFVSVENTVSDGGTTR